MAKITTFAFGTTVANISEKQGPTPHLVAPQVVLRPAFIPSNFSFGVTFGIRGVDITNHIMLRFFISSPSGTIVHDSGDTELPVVGKKDTLPAEYQGLVVNLDLRNIVIKEEGIYSLVVYINGEELTHQEIPIFKGKEDE